MKDSYQLLIEKLDAFIRKYYKNQLIRGVIYSFTLSLAFYLLVTTLEYFWHFSTGLRTTLFYTFVLGNLFIIGNFIVIPLIHLYRIGKIISHEQAAKIIGDHFGEVKDKLLNVLQLRNQLTDAGLEAQNSHLIEASINQKAGELKPVPFASAINLNENRKYLRYAFIPFLVLVVLLFTAPSLIKDSTKRLIEHGTYFEKPAPFTFHILNKDLTSVQQQDFQLDVKVEGNEVPQEAYVEIDNNQFKLDRENTVSFHHTFKNVQKNISFRLFADGVYSKEYTLEALPNPLLMNFEIALEYPGYLGKPNEKIQNTGDLVIPAGTKVSWKFHTQNTEALKLNFQDSLVSLSKTDENSFAFSKRFTRNDSYTVSTSNHFLHSRDSIRYSISVIPDLYPSIAVEAQKDSFSTRRTYFKGIIKDDYGFSKLTFNYHYLKSSDSLQADTKGRLLSQSIGIEKNTTQDQFFHYWDVSTINISAGDEIEYYFEVTDNDGLSGGKSTRSQTQVFKAPTLKEIAENTSKNNSNIKSDLKESIEAAKQLQKDVAELNKKLLDKKEMNWEDKKKAADLLNREKDLTKKLEDIKNKNQQNNDQKSEYKEPNKDLLQKEQQLQALMDKMMTPELKKLMEELQKMMDQVDKAKLQEQLGQMKFDNKDLQKDLERTLELFKQMEFEQKLEDNINKLNELAKKEDDLSKKSDDKNTDSKDLKDKQNELSKEFDDFKKEMNDLEKKNEALEKPNDLEKTEEEQKDIQGDMKSSEEELSQGKKSKASKSQKKASEKMEALAQKMQKMKQDMEQEQAAEDEESLRALLENLLHLSFDQEKLMTDLKTMDINNPQYLKVSQQQRKLKDDAKMIEDSLFALSKRVIQIQSKVNQEIAKINQNIEASLDNLEDRLVPQARSRQQFVMTSVNDLALLLSEALNQMQQEQSAKEGGSCTKPGKGKPKSASALRKMQEELNKNMKKMMESMKNGNKPDGKKGQGQQQGMSEQLAKMAAQQEYIRNELNRMDMQENKDGKKALGDLQQIQKKMEESENDIVNRMISEQTLRRQDEILTRLLESEKAERERDQDEQRKSEEAKNNVHRNPSEFEEYKRLKLKEMELLRTVPPSLNSYYKKKVNDYFQTIEK